MRIESIDIQGFGKLVDREFALSPGVNLFFGPNESGKSTLQKAILMLLYGFYESDRARRPENLLRESLIPWQQGSSYAAGLDYSLDDGSRFRVERRFGYADQATRLIDLTHSREVTREFPQRRHGNVLFARAHLGMSKDLFVRTAFVGQGEIRNLLERGEDVVSAIAAVMESGAPDTSVAEAIARIDETIKSKVGTERARTTALPVARDRLRRAEETQAAILQARSDIREDSEEKDHLETTVASAEGQLDRLDLLINQAEQMEMTDRIARVQEINEQLGHALAGLAELRPFSTFPLEHRDQMTRLFERREALFQSVAELGAKVSQEAPDLEQATSERAELQRRIEKLAHLEGFPLHLRDRVTRTETTWRSTKDDLEDEQGKLKQVVRFLRALGARLRQVRPAYKLFRDYGPSELGGLRARWQDAVQAEREARDQADRSLKALADLGATEEQVRRLADFRRRLSPQEEHTLRERRTELMMADAQLARSDEQLRVLARSGGRRKRWLPLVAGLLLALLTGVPLAMLGLHSAALAAVIGCIAVAVMTFAILHLRDSRRQTRLQTLAAAERSAREARTSLQQEQRGTFERLGVDSWDQIEAMLQRHSLLAHPLAEHRTYLEALTRANARLAEAEGELKKAVAVVGMTELNQASLDSVDDSIKNVESLLRDIKGAGEDKRRITARIRELEKDLAEAQNTLVGLVGQGGIQQGTLEERLEEFRSRCEKKKVLEDSQASLGTVEEQIKRLRTTVDHLSREEDSLARVETSMGTLLKESGIELGAPPDYEAGRKQFRDFTGKREHYDELVRKAESVRQQRASALAGRSLRELEKESANLEARRLQILRRRPLLDGAITDEDIETLRSRRGEADQQREKDGNRIVELTERIRGKLEGLRPLAEVQEDIVRQKQEITKLESFRRSLDIAGRTLQEAADEHHREFAPRIEALLAHGLAQVTDHRYGQVHVGSEDLAVSLKIPETGQVRDPTAVSYGTQEQILVLLRIAVSELMSSQGESIPIILDDPFVNFDGQRLERMVGLLEQLSKKYQILLFSKDERMREWLQTREASPDATVTLMAG